MEVIKVNSSLSQTNDSEEKVYKVKSSKRGKCAESKGYWFCLFQKNLGGAFERNFCPRGQWFKQTNPQKFKGPGLSEGGGG